MILFLEAVCFRVFFYNTLLKNLKIEFWLFVEERTTPNEASYKLRLLEKSRYLSKQSRWRAIFFKKNNKKATKDDKERFSHGVKSSRSPPQVKDFMQFEVDLAKKKLKFRKVKNDFQRILREDMKEV